MATSTIDPMSPYLFYVGNVTSTTPRTMTITGSVVRGLLFCAGRASARTGVYFLSATYNANPADNIFETIINASNFSLSMPEANKLVCTSSSTSNMGVYLILLSDPQYITVT